MPSVYERDDGRTRPLCTLGPWAFAPTTAFGHNHACSLRRWNIKYSTFIARTPPSSVPPALPSSFSYSLPRSPSRCFSSLPFSSLSTRRLALSFAQSAPANLRARPAGGGGGVRMSAGRGARRSGNAAAFFAAAVASFARACMRVRLSSLLLLPLACVRE